MSRDPKERRHRRTHRHPEAIAFMASADFDAVPSLAEAMGLEDEKMPAYTHIGHRPHAERPAPSSRR